MTDIGRGRIDGEEDRLPWLEPVEDEEPEPGVGTGKLIAAVIVALLAIGLVIGGLFWLRERSEARDLAAGTGDLIAAPKGDYKVAPSEPGGMNVVGEGDAVFAASQGAPVDAAIDISKQPETPVAGNARTSEPIKTVPLPASAAAAKAPSAATPAAAPAAKPVPAKPVPAKPIEVAKAPVPPKAPPAKKPEPAKAAAPAGGPSVQLGAFSTEAKAQAAWSGLAGRFPALKSLSHAVSPVELGGKTLYRLRASAGDRGKATAVCRALTSAKEACSVVG